MIDSKKILNIAKDVISIQSMSIKHLSKQINDDFSGVVELIFHSKGRVVMIGLGKSANIANKLVATFNSTGQPALFIHAADALHGDLGGVQKEDIVIFLSKSGNTDELKQLIPVIKKSGNSIVAICGNIDSYLSRFSDFVLNSSVEKEACPNNLAPTCSTTAQLVLGDAIAVSLLSLRGFSGDDFAKLHPGGILGKSLYLRVDSLLNKFSKPFVYSSDQIKDVIVEISNKRMGATAVISEKNLVQGIITDGDLRRMLQKNKGFDKLVAADIMNNNPITISLNCLALDALSVMEDHNVSQLIVLQDNIYQGMIHMHDIIKEGIS